jgi:hypothetical protein
VYKYSTGRSLDIKWPMEMTDGLPSNIRFLSGDGAAAVLPRRLDNSFFFSDGRSVPVLSNKFFIPS